MAFTFRADMVSLLSDSTVPLVASERILIETWLEIWVPEFTGQNPELTIPLPMTWNPGEFPVVAISDQATRSLQFHGSNFGSRLQCHVHPKRSAAQLGWHGQTGAIRAASFEDFGVLPGSPFDLDAESAHRLEPSATIFAGELHGGVLASLDDGVPEG